MCSTLRTEPRTSYSDKALNCYILILLLLLRKHFRLFNRSTEDYSMPCVFLLFCNDATDVCNVFMSNLFEYALDERWAFANYSGLREMQLGSPEWQCSHVHHVYCYLLWLKKAEVRWNKITLEQTAFCANVARVYVLWNWWFSVYGLCGVCAHHAAVAMRSQKGLFIFLFPLVCESVLCHAIPLVLTDSAATATDCTDYIYIYSISDQFNRYNPS